MMIFICFNASREEKYTMKHKSLFLGFSIALYVLASQSFGNYVYSESKSYNSGIKTSATVGEFGLQIAGLASPQAEVSLQMVDSSVPLSKTAANDQGAFSLPEILINKGLQEICLKTIDQKKTGTSTGCVQFLPASASITLQDIFLPPTLIIDNPTVQAGSQVKIRGYSMPGAQVALHLTSTRTVYTDAKSDGSYMFDIDNMSEGAYVLSVTANYQGKESIKPVTTTQLTVLAVAGVAANRAWLYLLLLLIPFVILILFIAKKRFSQRRRRS